LSATQYDRLLTDRRRNPVVCPSVCDAVYCGSQGWCTGLNVVGYQCVPSRHVPILSVQTKRTANKKAVLSKGEPRDAAVNFDAYRIFSAQQHICYSAL